MKKVLYTPPPLPPSNYSTNSRKISNIVTKPLINGKGDKLRKGANLIKYRSNFDLINWKHIKLH